MTRIDPVNFQGQDIVPIQFLAKLLLHPASLGPLTKGKTCIGCPVVKASLGRGAMSTSARSKIPRRTGRRSPEHFRHHFVVKPAMIGTKMVAQGVWRKPGVEHGAV